MPRFDPGRLATDVVDLLTRALTPILARLAGHDAAVTGLEARTGALEQRPDLAAALAAARDELGTVRERVALLEARPPLPGPAGDRGADGVGFADPPLVYDGERTWTFAFADGSRVVVTPPLLIYRDVYTAGRLYARGDVVTANGNLWHCNAPTTTAPGRNVDAWTLIVRRGRDATRSPATP